MKKITVVYAHPNQVASRANKALIRAIDGLPGVSISNLYAQYPDGKIDVMREQQRLLDSDLIILQFPFYWYNTTPLMKQWLDEVFLSGFAYGEEGNKLAGKSFMISITVGSKQLYAKQKGFTLPDLLKPFEFTAMYCKMQYQPPFVVEFMLDDQELEQEAQAYATFLKQYVQGEVTHVNTI